MAKRKQPRRKKKRATLDESRIVQIKSAVRPLEKALIEKLAKARDQTVSNMIRDWLIDEINRAGIGPRDLLRRSDELDGEEFEDDEVADVSPD